MTSSSKQEATANTPWSPPAAMKLHSGRPLDPKLLFFASPPAEIGEVISGYSSLKKGQPALARLSQIPADIWQGALFLGILAGFIPGLIIGFIPGGDLIGLIVGLLAGFGVLGFMVWVALAPRCTYVGTKGFAELMRMKGKLTDPDIRLFEKARELRTEETRKYKGNAYQGTSYTFSWTDDSGAEVFKVSGLHVSENNTPHDKNDYTLGLAAERAWTAFAFERAKKDLGQNGGMTFRIKNGDLLTLGDGFIEITRGSEHVRLNREDMPMLIIEQGVVMLEGKNLNQNYFGLLGPYEFSYYDLANASLFLALFDSLVKPRSA
jgi:hypothetical protein